jgi:multicomponent Na+:H+ antiporter subunit C
MESLLALVVGVLFGTAVYLMLRRNLVRVFFGLIVLTNAANVLIFAVGRVTRGAPPVIPEGQVVPVGAVGNPLTQALIVTAIVIGFGLLAFALTLIHRAQKATGTIDGDQLRFAEPPDEP